jgi:hypothetical protein
MKIKEQIKFKKIHHVIPACFWQVSLLKTRPLPKIRRGDKLCFKILVVIPSTEHS